MNEQFLLDNPLELLPDVGHWYHANDGSMADWLVAIGISMRYVPGTNAPV